MKKFLLFCGMMLTALTLSAQTNFVNLTPRAKTMSSGTTKLTLPATFTVGVAATFGDSVMTEAQKLVDALNATLTGTTVNLAHTTDGALVKIESYTAGAALIGTEGYKFTCNADGVTLSANTCAGVFHAIQTLKKVLPAHVMAGVKDPSVTTYEVPCATITDSPRFSYRGFMLDVSRHFFTVEEVKRMIDIMAAYKMNVFHWHLTDDQGWRAEIKKYPKLTTVGATTANCRNTDIKYGTFYTNEQYGPLFYTQEEMREVVKYAAERHIQVLPEVDMPGHFVAAMAAYPEYSCRPNNPPSVWILGGVSNDVLNVANDKAVQFAKDIIDELCDIFPMPYFHIGGDECPTTYWESNADCQKLFKSLGLTNYRQLQSRFINQISGHLASKGKRTVMWNESITAGGANLDQVKEYNPVIMCWNPCQGGAEKAASLGLDAIITEYHASGGGYYINRKQSNDPGEPDGAGYGDDTVQGCYNYNPVQTSNTTYQKRYIGVQGTFWCEWVANNDYLEYLALPRLICVAEAGWSQQSKKDWNDFKKRMTEDTKMLDYNNYQYGKHWMDGYQPTPGGDDKIKVSTKDERHYYRLVTKTTDNDRKGRCIELVPNGSPLLTQFADKNIQVNRLWSSPVASEGDSNYDNQLWAFEKSGDKYALVCKANENGSVNPTATAASTSGRWDYSNAKNFNFTATLKGTNADGTNYYTFASDKHSGQYMNCSMMGQGMSVNLYSDPSSGDCGYWTAVPIGEDPTPAPSPIGTELTVGDTIVISCAVEGFEGTMLSDPDKSTTNLRHKISDEVTMAEKWYVSKVTVNPNNQVIRLKNCQTKRYIAAPAGSETGAVHGYAINVGATAADVELTYDAERDEYYLSQNGRNFFPLTAKSLTNPNTICSGNTAASNAVRPQGAAWKITFVKPTTGIKNLRNTSAQHYIYNISGQRLAQAQPGCIIVDGVKKFVK